MTLNCSATSAPRRVATFSPSTKTGAAGVSPVPGRDEYWFYILGEFANAAWAFEQSDGDPDVLAYRDWRAIIGLERKIIGGISSRIELGYVFNRDIKVASISGDDISLDSSLLLRTGISY